MQTRVKFTQFGHNTATGNFGPGDVLVCSQSMARHLVEQVGCAKYDAQPTPATGAAQPAAAPSPIPAAAPRRRGGASAKTELF